jgi:PST family polysaccharide transporter
LAYGVAAPVTIALAAAGYGIWSLVANQLILRSVEIAVLLALCGWLPRPTVSVSHIRDLLSFGTHSIGFRAVSYFSMQIDRLLIGAVLGAVDLGHYAMARRIVDGGVYTLTGFMNTVALSAFSPLQGHDDKLAAALIAATRLASIIVFPALIGLAIVAPLVVGLLLTPEWDPAALIIQILAFHGLFLSMVMFLISVVRAKGQSGTTLIITMVGAALNVAACVGAVSFGIESVAIATIVVDLIVFPIWFHRAARLIPLTVGAYVGSFVPATVSTVCMTGSVLLAEYLLQSVATTGVRLAAAVATGVTVYGVVVSIVARPALVEIARLMRKR